MTAGPIFIIGISQSGATRVAAPSQPAPDDEHEGRRQAIRKGREVGLEQALSGSRPDGYVANGDRFVPHSAGGLRFRGRYDAQVEVADHLVNPGSIEPIILQSEGVASTRAYTVPSRIAGRVLEAELAVAPGSPDPDTFALLRELRSLVEPSLVPRHLHIVDRVDRTESGNRRRQP